MHELIPSYKIPPEFTEFLSHDFLSEEFMQDEDRPLRPVFFIEPTASNAICLRHFYPEKDLCMAELEKEENPVPYTENHRFFYCCKQGNLNLEKTEVYLPEMNIWADAKELASVPGSDSIYQYQDTTVQLPDFASRSNTPSFLFTSVRMASIDDFPEPEPLLQIVMAAIDELSEYNIEFYASACTLDQFEEKAACDYFKYFELLYKAGLHNTAWHTFLSWSEMTESFELDTDWTSLLCDAFTTLIHNKNRKKLYQKLGLTKEEFKYFLSLDKKYPENFGGLDNDLFGMDASPLLTIWHLLVYIKEQCKHALWIGSIKIMEYFRKFPSLDLYKLQENYEYVISVCLQNHKRSLKAWLPDNLDTIKIPPKAPKENLAAKFLKTFNPVLKATSRIIKKNYFYEDDHYVTVFPQNYEDMMTAQTSLSNCMARGEYHDNIFNQDSYVGFIKDKANDRICCALEFSGSRLLQCRSFCNENPENHDPDGYLIAFLSAWKLAVLDRIDQIELKHRLTEVMKQFKTSKMVTLYRGMKTPVYNKNYSETRRFLSAEFENVNPNDFEFWTSDPAITKGYGQYLFTLTIPEDEISLCTSKRTLMKHHLINRREENIYLLDTKHPQYASLNIQPAF